MKLLRLRPAEQVVWHGRPHWRAVAMRVLRLPWIALLVGFELAATARWQLAAHGATVGVLRGVAILATMDAVVLGFVLLLAWLMARTTSYTITDQRVVMRFGIALPATLVLPHTALLGADLALHADHTGDIALRLRADPDHDDTRLNYFRLWPHARAWRISQPQPMLRAVPQGAMVGAMLARNIATARANGLQVTATAC